MNNPEISIIVPVYNIASFIGDCIESILNQSFHNFELILIDDGSTDGSLNICCEYKERDSRIVIFDGGHQGVGKARNLGMDRASGSYICFIDGDDLVHPEFLERLYNVGRQNEADIVIGEFQRINSDYKIDAKADLNTAPIKELSEKEVFILLSNNIIYMTVWGKLYKKTVLSNQRFKDFSLGEDIEFNTGIYSLSKKFFNVPLPLYLYRNRANSAVSSGFSLKKFDNVRVYMSVYEKIKKEKPEFKHYVLLKLYKYILSFFYDSFPEYKKEAKALNYTVINKTIKDFIFERRISPHVKLFFIISLKIPIIYNLFRKIMEWVYSHELIKAKY